MEISKYSNAYGKINLSYDYNSDSGNTLKETGKNCDSFEKIDLSSVTESWISENYNKYGMKVMESQGIPGAAKNSLFSLSSDLMKDYYDGKIDEDRVKNQIQEYVKQYTTGLMEKDNHASKVKVNAVMSDLYEYMSMANTRAAVNMNQKAAAEYWNDLGVKGSGLDAYSATKGTVYYDSKYYRQCEYMQNMFKQTFDDISDKYGVSKVDYEAVEKNTKFSLDGGITFNGVWNHTQYQTNHYWIQYESRENIVEESFVPPDDFVYAYTNLIEGKGAQSILKYLKDTINNESVADAGSIKKNLMMEIKYGGISNRSRNKIEDYLREINADFLISGKTKSFPDFYRMASYR